MARLSTARAQISARSSGMRRGKGWKVAILIRSVGVDGYCAEGWEKCFFNIGAKACYASRLAGSAVGNVSFND